jgi:hypothetical protein
MVHFKLGTKLLQTPVPGGVAQQAGRPCGRGAESKTITCPKSDTAGEIVGGGRRTLGEARRQKYAASSTLPLRYANSPAVTMNCVHHEP